MAKVIFQNSRKWKGEWVTPFLPYTIEDNEIEEAQKLGATVIEGATKVEPKKEEPKEEPKVEPVETTDIPTEEPKEEPPKKKGKKR